MNAQSRDISYLFEYPPDTASDNEIFHFSPNSEGSCLTYSKSDDSLLDSKGTIYIDYWRLKIFSGLSEIVFCSGVACDSRLPPLCYRTVETASTIEEECGNCPADNSVSCNKWVDLADFPLTSQDFTIPDTEICVEPCGARTEPGIAAEMFCNVSLFKDEDE